MTSKTRILLAEDDPNLGTLLQEYLEAKDFETVLCKDGDKAFKTFSKQQFDFVILDVMMPVKDGFTVAKEIRTMNKKIPIIFLTAKSMKEDTLKGFGLGADDYITKPFSMEELLVRVNAILRRTDQFQDENQSNRTYDLGQFKFDVDRQILKNGDGETKLTTKENDLLHLLCVNQNGVLERNYALNAIWGDDNYFNGRSMDVYIAKLRKHLKPDDKLEIINVHGKGFKLLVEP
ncbi:MAG: response regulator [Bacteroidetes bacterium]|jgi:DNA-binding response OmpR family regulator|nr:response regulator [Bacteroidota bacterium]